jgi:DNA-binding transcriptional MocR family regulator
MTIGGQATVDLIADTVEDRSARGLAAAVSRLARGGSLGGGTRLPTVRDVARRLGVSPTTVSEAWQTLAQAGVLETRGRLGSFVLERPRTDGRQRYRRVTAPGTFALDLSTGTPDPELLPDLRPALARIGRRPLTTSYLDDPVLPELAELLRAQWPFPPGGLTVVDGATDGLDRVASQLVRLGDRVVVENPTYPTLIDLLELLGAEVVGVEVDDEGVVPAALAAALAVSPTALFLQPRAHNPLGVSLTRERAATLAALLTPADVVVVEDDHAGDIARAPAVSLGEWLPERTVLVRSFSKSHGPDLRLAAVGGRAELVARAEARRLVGPGWSSRLLQAVLVELLTDDAAVAGVATARDRYAERRSALVAALHERGVMSTGDDGINVWLDVRDERNASVALAAHGIGVAPGTPFCVSPLAGDHVRVTVSLVRDGVPALADALAAAAGHARRGAPVGR